MLWILKKGHWVIWSQLNWINSADIQLPRRFSLVLAVQEVKGVVVWAGLHKHWLLVCSSEKATWSNEKLQRYTTTRWLSDFPLIAFQQLQMTFVSQSQLSETSLTGFDTSVTTTRCYYPLLSAQTSHYLSTPQTQTLSGKAKNSLTANGWLHSCCIYFILNIYHWLLLALVFPEKVKPEKWEKCLDDTMMTCVWHSLFHLIQ